MSNEPDYTAYKKCMEEIKRRQLAIDHIVDRKTTTSYAYTNWEFIALQFRIIFELIVLSSLASHRHLFEKLTRRLRKEWQISAIVRTVRDKNPKFYPRPIRRVPSKKVGVKDDWLEVKDGYLTLADLVEAHGKIGSVMHARNPYADDELLSKLKDSFPVWREKVIGLLNHHTVEFPDQKTILYVGMQSSQTGSVHTTLFQKLNDD